MERFNPVKHFAIFIGMFLIVTSLAQAKMISGQVSGVDSGTRKVSVSTVDPATGQSSTSDIWLNPDATYSGVASLDEIKSGDQIWMEAEEDSEGNLRATKVTKS